MKGWGKKITDWGKENLVDVGPSEEDRHIARDIDVARDETHAKYLADFEAKLAVAEKKHDAELVVVASKYEEKCKEAHILETELEVTNKEVGVMGD